MAIQLFKNLKNQKDINESIGKIDFKLEQFSGNFNLKIPVARFSNALIDFEVALCYDSSFSDSVSYGTLSTGFPKGWKLNIQQYLYMNSGVLTYIDGENKKHIFELMENSSITYFDKCGSYLTAQLIAGKYRLFFPNGDYYIFNGGKLESMNFAKGSSYVTLSFLYLPKNNKLASLTIDLAPIFSVAYSTNSISLRPFGVTADTITLNLDANNCLTSISGLDNSNYSLSYLTNTNSYVLNYISFNSKHLSLSFDSNNGVTSLDITKSSTNLGSYSLTYYSNSTLSSYSPFGNSSLTTSTLYEYDSKQNIIRESLIGDNVTQRAKQYHFDDRFNYVLDTCSNKAPAAVTDINDNVVDTEISQTLINNTTLFLRTYPDSSQSFLISSSFLYFELSAQSSVSSDVSFSLYRINVINQTESLIYSGSRSVTFNGSTHLTFFIPLLLLNVDSYLHKLKLVVNKTGSDNIYLHSLRLYIFNSSINYVKTETNNSTYVSSYSVDKSDNPMLFNSSYQTQFVISGVTRNLDIEKEDSIIFFAYQLLGKHYLFYNDGTDCIALTLTQLADINYEFMSISNYKYTIDGRFINFFSTIEFTSLNVESFYLSDANHLTMEKIRCDFDENNPNDIRSKAVFNNYLNVITEVDESSKIITNTYTSLGALITSTKTLGVKEMITPTLAYSSNNTISSETLSLGNITITKSYDYDSRLRLTEETISNNNPIVYTYNNRDNLIGVSQSNKNTNIVVSNNKITDIYSNSSNYFSFSYSALSTYTIWNGQTWEDEITNETNTYSKTININGDNVTYRYDKFNRLIEEIHSVNYRVISYTYSSISTGSKLLEISAVDENDNTIFDYKYSYDEYGRAKVSNYDQFPKRIVDYNPNQDSDDSIYKSYRIINGYFSGSYGNQLEYISTRFNKSQGVFYKTIFDNSINVIHTSALDPTFANDLNYESVSINGVLKFSSFLEPISSNNQEIQFVYQSSFIAFQNVPVTRTTTYDYSSDENISSISYPYFLSGVQYSYNSYNEISSESNPYFGAISYSYDLKGNLTTIVKNNVTTSISFDSYNKISSLSIGGVSYSFSYNNYGYPTTYKNNLMSYSGNNVLRYGDTYFTYDALGRRTSKYIDNNNKTDYYFVDGHLFMERKRINGTWYQYNFIYGSTGIIGIKLGDEIYIYHKDILGNIIALYDSSGNFVAKYIYDAYGNHAVLDNNNNIISSSTHVANLNPFRYRGYYYDVETGLYNLGYRFYDPELGRFVTPDAFSYLELDKIDGTNLYSYCYGNPIAYVDKDGHSISIGLLLIGFGVGAALGAGVSIVSQGFTNGWNNINGWQVAWDAAIGGIGGMITFGTFGTLGSALASASLGFIGSVGGDVIANNGDWSQINWYKAGVFGAVNGVLGYLSGPGLQNKNGELANMIDFALSNFTSYKAIMTAAARYGTGPGFQKTINFYYNQLIADWMLVAPSVISLCTRSSITKMSASSSGLFILNWANKYFDFWD